MVSSWKDPTEELPKMNSEVLIKCKGWDPKIASYITNPHCECGIWVIYDSRNIARLVNAPIELWTEIPKIKG